MIRVKIYTILELKKVLGQREFEVSIPDGSTVRGLISWMTEKWGGKLSRHLFHPDSDRILPYLRLMVNGRDIQFLNGMETVLHDGDGFSILPILTGG